MTLEMLRDITSAQIERSNNLPPTNGAWRNGKVVSIHDGDTCDLVVINNRRLERFVCRLADIDTPELSTGGRARKARDFLGWLSMGNDPADWSGRGRSWNVETLQNRLDANVTLVQARFQGVGFYERQLVVLRSRAGNQSFNNLLVEHGYAETYRRRR